MPTRKSRVAMFQYCLQKYDVLLENEDHKVATEDDLIVVSDSCHGFLACDIDAAVLDAVDVSGGSTHLNFEIYCIRINRYN